MVKVIGKFNPQLPQTGFSQPKPQQPQQGDSKLTTAARNVISPALTAGEAIAGGPGDILQAVTNLLGIESEPGKGTAQVPFSSQGLRKNIREPLSKYFGTERLTLPQGEMEERFNDFVGDFASIFSANKDPKKALKVAGLGNLAGFAAHQFGASEGEEGIAKAGTMLLSSLHGGRAKLAEDAAQRYKSVETALKDKSITANNTVHDLDGLKSKLSSGGSTPAKKLAEEQVDKLLGQFYGKNHIKAENLWDFKKDMNEILQGLRKGSSEKKYIEQLIGIAKNGLKNVGSDIYNQLSAADEIFGSLAASDKIGSFLNKNIDRVSIKTPYLRSVVKNIGGIGTLGTAAKLGSYATGLPTAGILLGAGGVGAAANEGFKFMNLLHRSPIARQTYLDLLADGLKGNAKAAIRNTAKLDKIAADFEEKEPPKNRVRVIGKLQSP